MLLRRSFISIFHAVVDLLNSSDDDALRVCCSPAVRAELRAARGVLILLYADVCRKVLPLVLAQDASGGDAGGHGAGAWASRFRRVQKLSQLRYKP